MKVGIITHHWLGNFGANLQALSTVRVLRSLGHDPIIINYRIPVIAEKYAEQVSSEQLAVHEQFCRDFLPESEVCSDQKTVAEVAAGLNLDAVVSGSDAVLRLTKGSDREDLSFPHGHTNRAYEQAFLLPARWGVRIISWINQCVERFARRLLDWIFVPYVIAGPP